MNYLIIRSLSSLFSGVIFSQCGSLIQLSTRNILASPSTLGFDGMAILWILVFHSISLFLGFSPGNGSLISIGIPFFLLLSFIFSKVLSGKGSYEKTILLGLSFNLFVGAIFSLWQFFFMAFNIPFPVELWFGHFRFAASEALSYLLLTEMAIICGLLYFRKKIFLFSLGSGVYQNWGIKPSRLFQFFIVVVALGTFVVVALFGAFSFMGLVLPIISRKLWFRKFGLKGELLLGSFFNGICLMLIDLLCYFCPIYGAEIPVGLIVTAVGAVSLILLLWRSHNKREILAKQGV